MTDSLQTESTPVEEDPNLARRRQKLAWNKSPERKAWTRTTWRVLFAEVLILLVGSGVYIFSPLAPTGGEYLSPTELLTAPVLASFTVFYFTTLALAGYWLVQRRYFREGQIFGESSALRQEEKAIAENTVGELELSALWVVTQRRIDFYHRIATTQAENSFRLGQIASIAGFSVVIALGVFASFSASSTGAIAASVVGVAGAAMTAFIGATFMKAQAEASAQLKQFFYQPVEFARLLGAERLIATLPEVERSQAVQGVIRTMMGSATHSPTDSSM